jgi:hypothetical protein
MSKHFPFLDDYTIVYRGLAFRRVRQKEYHEYNNTRHGSYNIHANTGSQADGSDCPDGGGRRQSADQTAFTVYDGASSKEADTGDDSSGYPARVGTDETQVGDDTEQGSPEANKAVCSYSGCFTGMFPLEANYGTQNRRQQDSEYHFQFGRHISVSGKRY